ncbi:hypothetical protein [Vibrio cholerae]|nr:MULTISPECIES: hypothetical protein [Vibrio]MCU4214227.1 hypothetical protein [Vibrio cholerae]
MACSDWWLMMRLLPLLLLFSTSAFASTDCEKAESMLSPSVHLVVQALRLHKQNADHKTIAQWRVNTFNPEIEKIITANELSPKELMSPDLSLTREVYNDVMMRSKIYVGHVYSYSKGTINEDAVEEQRKAINAVVQKFKSICVSQ